MDQPTYQPYGQTGSPAQGQQFPPPPPNSGAGQSRPVPIAEAYSNPGAQGRFSEDHFYAPPPQPVRPQPASDALPNPTSQQQMPASQPFQPTSALEAGAVHVDPHS